MALRTRRAALGAVAVALPLVFAPPVSDRRASAPAGCAPFSTAYGGAVDTRPQGLGCGEAKDLVRKWLSFAHAGAAAPEVGGFVCSPVRAGSVSELVTCRRGRQSVSFRRLLTASKLPELSLYSRRSPFNRRIAGTVRVDPRSAAMVRGLAEEVTEGGATLGWRRFTVPVYFAGPDSPRVRVRLTAPWRPRAAVTRVPIPSNAAPDPAGDGHLAIIDRASGCEYDFWQARRHRRGWTASWGHATSIRGSGLYRRGFSARGSGFALLAGLVWPHELARGRIDHALIFSYPRTRAGGPVSPATESDGRTRRADAIPEGARLQLDPTLDLGSLGLQGYELTIARALQEYGAYLGDTGGRGLTLYAVHPMSARIDPYRGLVPPETYPSLANIPFDRLRVLRLPRQRRQRLRAEPNRCVRFVR